MDDTISRQAAIDALLELVEARRTWIRTEAAQKEISGIDASMCAIHDLPSAERRGRWVVLVDQIENQTFDECKCSECGCVEYFNKGWKHFDYCPNCGARMEVRKNDITGSNSRTVQYAER